eukprot:7867874-Pyramimonas_sp.AAC.1
MDWVKYMRRVFCDFPCQAHTFHVYSEGLHVATALQQLGHHILQQQQAVDIVLAGAPLVPANKIAAYEATPPKQKHRRCTRLACPLGARWGLAGEGGWMTADGGGRGIQARGGYARTVRSKADSSSNDEHVRKQFQ